MHSESKETWMARNRIADVIATNEPEQSSTTPTDNLRSISAIIAAQKNQEKSPTRTRQFASRQLWKSSKVVPQNNNVFSFDDDDDTNTITDVLSHYQYGPTKEYRQRTKQLREKRRCKCIGILVGILIIVILGIITTVVLIALLIPTLKKSNRELSFLTSTNETVYGIWNTTMESDSNLATAGTAGMGKYYSNAIPDYAFDRNSNSKYTSYGSCNFITTLECGENTGVYLTPKRGLSLLVSFRFCTAHDLPESDPLTVMIEGSNQSFSQLIFSSSWIPIYNGTTGLTTDPGRSKCGNRVTIDNNAIWYLSYRILITSKRNIHTSVQYSEIELLGYFST